MFSETKSNGNGSMVPNVAIACQGGGSHAAFAAGLLSELLAPVQRERFRITALSGTSGGAMCAALVWRGLIASGPDEARERLLRFWRDLSARGLFDAALNFWDVWLARWPFAADVTAYLAAAVVEPSLRRLLQTHLDFEHFDADVKRRSSPELFIGATDVLDGERVIFRGQSLNYDHVVASAAVPPLFRAIQTDGRWCWDGLFTTNPPVREFTDLEQRPDEIWVVQINPQRRTQAPRSLREIKDRTNELSGNLSLGQELYFIDRINRLVERHEALREKYKAIRIRVVELDAETLDYPSKLDRRGVFIEQLLEAGRERADWFFDDRSTWPRERTTPPAAAVVGDVRREHRSSGGADRAEAPR